MLLEQTFDDEEVGVERAVFSPKYGGPGIFEFEVVDERIDDDAELEQRKDGQQIIYFKWQIGTAHIVPIL